MYLLCIHIEYVLVHDSIRRDLVWPQSISPRTSPVRRTRARVAAPGLLEPRWPSEGTAGHAGAAPGRAVGTQAAPRTRGARPRCAPGENRSGRPWLGRARARWAAMQAGHAGPNREMPAPGRMRRAPWPNALRAPRRGARDTAGWPRRGQRELPPATSLRAGRAAGPRTWGRSGWLGKLAGAAPGHRDRAPAPSIRDRAGPPRPRARAAEPGSRRGRLGFGAGSRRASSSMGGGARSRGRRLPSMAGEGAVREEGRLEVRATTLGFSGEGRAGTGWVARVGRPRWPLGWDGWGLFPFLFLFFFFLFEYGSSF
jgi:hypothetical protein